MLAEAFGQLPLHVVWKTPGFSPTSTPKNVLTTQWFPQNDLLGHPKVVGFFSHGGLNSVSEAAFHGVPVIGYPLFGDQWDNIARLEYKGMAKSVDTETCTAASIAETIIEVTKTESYSESARKVAAVIRDTPKKPVELAADLVEYTIRHNGADFQRIPGLDAPWYVQRGYDVMLTLFVILFYLPYLLISKCCCAAKVAKSKKA